MKYTQTRLGIHGLGREIFEIKGQSSMRSDGKGMNFAYGLTMKFHISNNGRNGMNLIKALCTENYDEYRTVLKVLKKRKIERWVPAKENGEKSNWLPKIYAKNEELYFKALDQGLTLKRNRRR